MSAFLAPALLALVCVQTSGSAAAPPDVAAAVATLQDFDRAWALGDIDALMAPIAADFGCELFGQVGVADLEATLRQLHADLDDSTSTTTVLATHVDGPIVSIFVRREFVPIDPATGPRETLELVFHMRADAVGAMRVAGMEEFDADALAQIHDDTYVGAAGALRLKLPGDWLALPAPPSGPCIEHLRLRRDGLSTELDVMLLSACSPIDLTRALDVDLQAFLRRTPLGKVETIAPTRVCGLPARAAQARYDGAGCGLAGKGNEDDSRPRRLSRTYVLLDRTLLLAFDLRTDASDAVARKREFDALLGSLTLDLAPDESLADRLARARFGAGNECGRFEQRDIGFSLAVTPRVRLQPVATNAVLTLQVTPADGAGPDARIDAIRMLDPEQQLEEFVAADDAAFDERLRRLGRHGVASNVTAVPFATRALRAERTGSIGTDCENVVYLRRGGVLFTVRWNGPRSESADANALLAELVGGITLAP